MVARFILSLDGEGKWGVADHLNAATHRALCDASLKHAYRELLALLDEFGIPATFAFVGCFSASHAQLTAMRPQLEALAQDFLDYLAPALADMTDGTREGWAGDWAMEMVKQAKMPHELALHGMTHIPWNHAGMNEAQARRELALGYEAGLPLLAEARTFIYPRNAVRFTQLLAERGIVAYREAPRAQPRLLNLLAEFNLFSQPERDLSPSTPLAIPAGFFVNWRQGLRRCVPITLTRLRARLLLRRAAKTGGVVHYWLHPENIASAPDTLRVLRAILEEVVAMRDSGQCRLLTQAEYAAEQNAILMIL